MSPLHRSWHLVTRFFGVLASRRLTPAEQQRVRASLTPAEARLFWDQQPIDQRHAFDVAERVRASLGDHQQAVAAALLHDVGKRHSRLGPLARSMATVGDLLHLPLPAAWRRYRDHDRLGAADLEEIGAGPLSVAFAAGSASGDPMVWDALIAADDGRGKGPKSSPSGNSMPPEVSR